MSAAPVVAGWIPAFAGMTIWNSLSAPLGWRRVRRDPAAGLGDLEAALAGDDCPVCARTAGADDRWLDHFLYEGYLEREVMRSVGRAGGFCAHHARRTEAMGSSATIALIYLALIRDCLPRLADRRDRRHRPVPLLAAPEACEACAQAEEAERRDCFFLALLIGARGPRCYGKPAIVCMPHLACLVGYLDDASIGAALSTHSGLTAALGSDLAGAFALDPEAAADRTMRVLLGPPRRTGRSLVELMRAQFADDPDPVRRMRRRLRHLPGCAVCAEISEACDEWLGWLADAAEDEGDLSDVLPLCRDHVWQARCAAGVALAPALAAAVLREAEDRLAYAAAAREAGRGSALLPAAARRAFAGSAARNAVLESLRRGRECPLCRRAREAGERAVLLLAALLESAGGRRAFESGYGVCVRHAALAMAMPNAPALGEIVAATTYARLALLRWELEEQLRRGAWQSRPQRRGAESAAWLKAGARFAGTA